MIKFALLKVNLIILLREAQIFLKMSLIETFSLDARILLEFIINKPAKYILMHKKNFISNVKTEKFKFYLYRRALGEPLSYIIKKKEFFGKSFNLTYDTLVPRYDSEVLIKSIIYILPKYKICYRFLDLGTGSGCLIGILLVEYCNSIGMSIDISYSAISQAMKNLFYLGCFSRSNSFIGSWCSPLIIYDSFDFILANPPYIVQKNISFLSINVKHYDSFLSLSGGFDGLLCYRSLSIEVKSYLNPGGFIVLEIGKYQEESIIIIFKKNGWRLLVKKKDFTGKIRSLIFYQNN